jgi:hypothetical protein
MTRLAAAFTGPVSGIDAGNGRVRHVVLRSSSDIQWLRGLLMMLRSGALVVLCLAMPRLADAGEAVIAVDAAQKASYTIPRTIFGTFHEPILSSNYGGLWAQILVNPSFEENLWSAGNLEEMVEENPALRGSSRMGLPLPWESLHPEQGWRFEPRWKDAANSLRSPW